MIRETLHLSVGFFVVSAAKYLNVTLVIALSTLSLVAHPGLTSKFRTST